jgi:hypothetical protein
MLVFFLQSDIVSTVHPELRNLQPANGHFRVQSMNIIEKTDEELLQIALPMWDELIKYSNKRNYGKFIRNFSYDLLLGLNEVELGKQFAKSELTRSLSTDYDFLGFIRRGEHVTCLFRVRSTKKAGEWLGRMVIGYERGEVRIFAASIF